MLALRRHGEREAMILLVVVRIRKVGISDKLEGLVLACSSSRRGRTIEV